MVDASGLIPCEHNILLKPAKVEERTKGGLIRPQDVTEREQWAETRGEVVAVSPYAFEDFGLTRADPGDTVMHARHAGVIVEGLDGEKYRLVKDTDVVALIRGGAHG